MGIVQICGEVPFKKPEGVYERVRGPNTYLLESREGSEKLARYSIIGFDAMLKLTIKNGVTEIKFFKSGRELGEMLRMEVKGAKSKLGYKDPLDTINFFMQNLKPSDVIITPRPGVKGVNKNVVMPIKMQMNHRFAGGCVGYLSYDFIRYFVDLEDKGKSRDDLRQPDGEFVLAKSNIIMDNKQKRAYFISNEADLDLDYNYDYEDVSTGVERQMAEIMQIETGESKSNTAKKNGIVNVPEGKDGNRKGMEGFSSNMSQGEYEECVRAAKEYIHAGDIFQVVLSQRLETDFDGDGNCNGDYFGVYQNLSEINPSPYMYFLDFGERKVIGASPEMLVRVEGNRIETCPIAGTRGRGRNERDDRRLEEEMLRDEKERAEHLMLVDLARNDVGKVSKFGSVRVKRFMYAEKYSHVQHIVSEVIGELREDKSEYDVLRATFPAGTVSGAPKVRAMEIIEEMEPTRRGIYAGCVGYFSFNHNVDTAITIRTGVFEGAKAYVQAGAGIVADSDPTREYYETMSKCAALLECMSGGGGL